MNVTRIGLAILGLAFAATAEAQAKRKNVEISLPIPVAEAATRVTLAAVRSGLMVASNENGVITLAAYEIPDVRPPVMLTLRVNLVAIEGNSLAVVGGTWSHETLANMQKRNPIAGVWSSEGAAEEGGKGYIGKAFKEVEKFAAAISAEPQVGGAPF
ncbi:MAG TPA: hypothetical protein VNO75_12325 [Gemmatimonadaceae bacterium]|nr:hypothetical protein [Gemmatimonadaceae bacterium]